MTRVQMDVAKKTPMFLETEGTPMSEVKTFPDHLSARETVEFLRGEQPWVMIDVRTPAEYRSEHVPGSMLIPLDEFRPDRDGNFKVMPVPRFLLCGTGARARRALDVMHAKGIEGGCVIEGGIAAYKDAGGEVEIGRSRMSLERQVRIGAGSLVLLGLALALIVHPAFAGLSAFIGAGLVFAGITDWCGMGLLLAKAPWNR